jgi:hypothetical protein
MRLQRAWRAKQRALRRELRQMEATRQDIIEARRRAETSPPGQRRDDALDSLDALRLEWQRSYAFMQRVLDRVDAHVRTPRQGPRKG